MTNEVRAALCVGVLCLAGCGGGGSGTLSGKVAFSDGSEATGLRVTLLGPVGKRMDTPASGAYSFDKLPSGVYLLSVEAADTRELRLSFGAESDGSTAITAPDLVFSPLATLTGKVNDAAGPVGGASVHLSGSDRVAVTSSAGAFAFFEVPTGEYSVVAKAGSVIAQQASAMVKLKRGKNELAMPLVLANDLTASGKLEGTLALFNGTSPKDIKVSVGDLSAMTTEAGTFSLTLPPGEYDPVVEFAGYPRQSLGLARVRTGVTTTLPLKTLSIYKSFPWASRIISAAWLGSSESDIAALQVYVTTDYNYENYFIDTKTFERRLFALGFASNFCLSKTGKWAAFVPSLTSQGVIAVNSATGQIHSIPAAVVTSGPVISNDETTLMFFAAGTQNSLVRVNLTTGVVTTVPAFPGSYFQTNERFLARTTDTTPFDVQLVTPTGATTVFNNLQALRPTLPVPISNGATGYQLMWGYTCSLACSVSVLSSTAASASQVTAVIPVAPAAIPGSVKDWLGLSWGGATPGRALVKVSDGSSTSLPDTTTLLAFNDAATRVVTHSTGGLGYELREDVVPPNATSAVHFTSPTVVSGAYLSPTRYMGFGTGPSKRVDIKAGVATSDTDVTIDAEAQSPLLFPPGVLWVKTSTVKRLAAVYDSGELAPDTLGIVASYNFSAVGSRSAVRDSVLGKFAGFSDGASIFALDGIKSEVRRIGIGELGSNLPPFVSTDRMKVVRLAGTELQFYESGRVVSLSEPGMQVNPAVMSLPKGGTAAVGYLAQEPRNVLHLAVVP